MARAAPAVSMVTARSSAPSSSAARDPSARYRYRRAHSGLEARQFARRSRACRLSHASKSRRPMTAASAAHGWGLPIATSRAVTSHCPLREAAPCSEPQSEPRWLQSSTVTVQPLIAAHMDTAMFYDDCAYLPEWPGPPIGDEEGRIIQEALERTSPVHLPCPLCPRKRTRRQAGEELACRAEPLRLRS